mmetsp:Transcript_104783/g.305970  ORF Transcript_104783/g.305970 Transcript_104783/m.305970 type:complete len:530 (-) Transcript_104783:38-1627(-)
MAGHSNLYVYGLPAGTDDEGLRRIFETVGNIVSVRCMSDRRYGFVKFSSPAEAQGVIAKMNGHMVNGSRLTVMFAQRDQGETKGGGGWEQQAGAEPTPSPSLFVKGLPPNFTTEHTKLVFEMYGTVTSCQVLLNNAATPDGVGESHALVTMSDVDTAMWMVTNLHGNIPQGLERPLTVQYAPDPAANKPKPAHQLAVQTASSRASPYGGKGSWKGGGNMIVLPSGQSVVVDGAGNGTVSGGGKGGAVGPGGKGYKTRLCSYFAEHGTCPSGDACTFAHGGHEVKGYKTRMCKYDAATCPQGEKCSFAHSGAEVKGFKTRMCKFEPGQCPAGDKCSFAHFAAELSVRPTQGISAAAAPQADAAAASAQLMQATQANASQPGGMSAEAAAALAGIWSALGSGDISSLAALGVDVNALAALGQVASAISAQGAQVAQPAFRQLGSSVVQPAAAALGNGAPAKGGGKGGFKTRLCTYFMEQGTCPNFGNCTFAHGPHEIHGWKTRMCKFADSGTCPQGAKCSFAHSATELVTR